MTQSEIKHIKKEVIREAGDDNKFTYKNMFYIINTLRKNLLVKGMLNEHRGKFESFLMDIFKSYDKKKLGYIELKELEEAILKIKNMKLTKLQKWIIRSSAPVTIDPGAPEIEMFDYKEDTNLIANLIKRLFSPAFLEMKVIYSSIL